MATILYNFMSGDGQTTVKDKIVAIINGDKSGGNSGHARAGEKSNENTAQTSPKRKQAKNVKGVGVSDEQLRQMSKIAYKDINGMKNRDFKGIFGVDKHGAPNAKILDKRDLSNGFQAIAVKNRATGEIVIAFRGSDTEGKFIDWWGQDATIWTQTTGVQEHNAKKFVEAVKKKSKAKDSSIVLTGHSLGGFHAQMAAKKTGLPAVTYNAPGVKPNPGGTLGALRKAKEGLKAIFNPRMNVLDDIKNVTGTNDDQVVNYVNEGDAIGNYGIHYGKTVVTGAGQEPEERNDYTSPLSSGEIGALFRAGKNTGKGGFGRIGEEHGLESFDGQFGKDGNISR
ncbi:Mbeg1-like protein [Salinithrix halophila]|uniref:Mbeg1-like protein n=1 Tax=Salinithrix halophila TaxID=1485204 RepID=A0ABV8JDT4_9BACL